MQDAVDTPVLPTIGQQLEKHAGLTPNAPALIHKSELVTYQALHCAVDELCLSLISLNVKPGDRVAIVAEKHPSIIALLLATMKIGAIAIPINPLLKLTQIVHILENSESVVAFLPGHYLDNNEVHSMLLSLVQRIIITTENTDEHQRQEGEKFNKHVEASSLICTWAEFKHIDVPSVPERVTTPTDQAAMLIYTSGSTGKPKGVVFSHSNLSYGALSVSTYLENSPADRILALMPLSFDYGLSQVTTALYSGASVVLYDYFMPKDVLNAVSKFKVTGLPAVPHVWDKLAQLEWSNVEHLRYITNTGGRLSEKTIGLMAEKLPGCSIYSMYGFTEAFRATYLPVEQLKVRPNSIGKAVPHSTILIVDDHGDPVAAGQSGELVQSGPLVTLGYWNDAQQTEKKFKPLSKERTTQYAWSGDLVRIDSEGYLYFVSRIDDQVKINGYRVNPSEIEETLTKSEYVLECAVLHLPAGNGEPILVAFIVTSEGSDLDRLLVWARLHLPTYMVPQKFVSLQSLPAGPNRKVDRVALAQYLDRITNEDIGDNKKPPLDQEAS